jgi:hypothetical protein
VSGPNQQLPQKRRGLLQLLSLPRRQDLAHGECGIRYMKIRIAVIIFCCADNAPYCGGDGFLECIQYLVKLQWETVCLSQKPLVVVDLPMSSKLTSEKAVVERSLRS